MANVTCSAFSHDSQYLAHCGNDGKLRIWEVASGRLKLEYVLILHASSTCSVLGWINVDGQAPNAPSLWKRRKKSLSEDPERKKVVAMGSTNGGVTLYSIASASVSMELKGGHSGAVTALTWSESSGLFTAGEDHHIVEWNIQENGIKCKWKSGKGKVTAIAVVSEGKSLISADRVIKWWDLSTKQLIHRFTGHANQVFSLNPIVIDHNSHYVISGASGEEYLNIWSLNETTKERNSVATLTMQDDVSSVSVQVKENSQVMILATTKSGQAHVYKYQPNGRCSKPLKPSLTVLIASESSQKESIQQIPILLGHLTDDTKLLLAYGSFVQIMFEKVIPDFTNEVQCLIRSDLKKVKDRKEEALSKMKPADTDGTVEYLTPGVPTAAVKRNKTGASSQIPLKDRLDNLSLNAEVNTEKLPAKGAGNMAQLLIQGLLSKDKTILNNVLLTKKESLIQNTINKLPVQAITPLLKELTTLLQGKTYPSKIAVTWLKALLATHAAHLLSHPDVGESLGPIMGIIDTKLTLLSELSRLRGRVSLVTGQISQTSEQRDRDITEESLLVYQDPDSSEDGTDVGEADLGTESDENWEEMSDQNSIEQDDPENGRSDDDVSMCS
ncbi:WD repeat-containing protein 43 [Orussus abietinus]|uniref:WD repeat-containing protein 43 n=1 Tax=Orussus abietinus TaxID=222816 RepID=UPI000625B521|nr:WD repeat-containing protein 43 [Orussus abietinus]